MLVDYVSDKLKKYECCSPTQMGDQTLEAVQDLLLEFTTKITGSCPLFTGSIRTLGIPMGRAVYVICPDKEFIAYAYFNVNNSVFFEGNFSDFEGASGVVGDSIRNIIQHVMESN